MELSCCDEWWDGGCSFFAPGPRTRFDSGPRTPGPRCRPRTPGSCFWFVRSAPDAWPRMPGRACLAPDAWPRMPGPGRLAPDVWRRMPGPGCLGPHTRSVLLVRAPGPTPGSWSHPVGTPTSLRRTPSSCAAHVLQPVWGAQNGCAGGWTPANARRVGAMRRGSAGCGPGSAGCGRGSAGCGRGSARWRAGGMRPRVGGMRPRVGAVAGWRGAQGRSGRNGSMALTPADSTLIGIGGTGLSRRAPNGDTPLPITL